MEVYTYVEASMEVGGGGESFHGSLWKLWVLPWKQRIVS